LSTRYGVEGGRLK